MDETILYPGVELEDFYMVMEGIRSKKRKITRGSRSEIKLDDRMESLCNEESTQPQSEKYELIELDSDSDIEEGFHAVADGIKYEETNMETQEIETTCVNPPIFSKMREIQKTERSLLDDKRLPSLCRLCAIPCDNMIDMFGPTILHKHVIKKIHRCLPITVTKTDSLTKKVCLLCLEKLESCYRFHEIVTQAEHQLLSVCKQMMSKIRTTTKFHHQACLQSNGHHPSDENAAEERVSVEGFDRDHNTINTEELSNADRDSEPRSSSCKNQNLTPSMESINRGRISASQSEQGVCHTAPNSPMPKACAEEEFQSGKCATDSVNNSSKRRAHFKCKIERHPISTMNPRYSLSREKPTKYNSIMDKHLSCGKEIIEHAPAGQSVGCNGRDKILNSETSLQQHMPVTHNERQISSGNLSGSKYRIEEEFNDQQIEHTFKCTFCKQEQTSVVSLKKHDKICVKDEGRYICDYCEKAFNQRCYLVRHIRTHTRGGLYSCHICSKSFIAEHRLTNHYKIHTGERHFKCSICEWMSRSGREMNQHMKSVHSEERPYACSVCNKRYKYASARSVHMATHKSEKLFKCDLCEAQFKYKSSIYGHKKKRHKLRTNSFPPYNIRINEEKLNGHETKYSFECTRCKRSFSSDDSFEDHKKSCINIDKIAICDYCGIAFTSKKGLIYHIQDHTGDRPHRCDMCLKTFSRELGLVEHRRTHTGERPYYCNVCAKRFTRRQGLVRHLVTHTGERPYSCGDCAMTFLHKYNLLRHRRIHTNERPYKCSLCDEKFRDKRVLKRHICKFHPEDA